MSSVIQPLTPYMRALRYTLAHFSESYDEPLVIDLKRCELKEPIAGKRLLETFVLPLCNAFESPPDEALADSQFVEQNRLYNQHVAFLKTNGELKLRVQVYTSSGGRWRIAVTTRDGDGLSIDHIVTLKPRYAFDRERAQYLYDSVKKVAFNLSLFALSTLVLLAKDWFPIEVQGYGGIVVYSAVVNGLSVFFKIGELWYDSKLYLGKVSKRFAQLDDAWMSENPSLFPSAKSDDSLGCFDDTAAESSLEAAASVAVAATANAAAAVLDTPVGTSGASTIGGVLLASSSAAPETPDAPSAPESSDADSAASIGDLKSWTAV